VKKGIRQRYIDRMRREAKLLGLGCLTFEPGQNENLILVICDRGGVLRTQVDWRGPELQRRLRDRGQDDGFDDWFRRAMRKVGISNKELGLRV
jgi:hypothetical protein